MKKLLITSCLLTFCLMSKMVSAFERNINMDFNWKFYLGEQPLAKNPVFDDQQWRQLNLPHDFSIEGEYNENALSGWRGGYLPTGVGWYRKELQWQEAWQGKRVILRFDGIYLNSDVWVNGQHLGHRPNGYVSFEYDITDELIRKNGKPYAKSVISVRADHQLAPTGRWYTGSGIYRHVWLDVVDETHVPNDGLFVRTDQIDFKNNNAILTIDTDIVGLKPNKHFSLVNQLIDAKGNIAASQKTNIVASATEKMTLTQSLGVAKAILWSTDIPYLYTLKTQIFTGDKLLDQTETRVGIRTIDYNVEQGFLLNNQPIELEGMSFHHDAGPVGAAVPDDVWRRRLQQLKEMGMNALRPAHTPFSPIFYDLADEMGFMVMNEAFDGWEDEKADFDYGLYFEQWWETDLASIIKRDRNHPSVVMWSVGNEVEEKTAATQKKLVDLIKSLDDTRPITQGRGYMLGHDDISGFNGHGEDKGFLEAYHRDHPNRTMVGTEITHTLQTRGIYRTKTSYRTRDNPAPWEKHDPIGRWNKMKDKVHMVPDFTEEEVFKGENPRYDSSYDNAIVRMNIREEIKMAKRLPYLLGTFRWTAFDYLGESFGWPARTANFGIIDLAGFEKDGYYLYQSQWSKNPMVHMLPHWTHPGKEGVEIPVVVYTNLPKAELFLNGRSLGTKKMTDDLQIQWLVPYQAGELKVVASDGHIERTKTIYTSGRSYSVKLTADKNIIRANQTDVSHIAVDIIDKKGNEVPRASNTVTLSLSGPGKIIGADNGDILDLTHHVAKKRKVFNGKLMVMVQSTKQKGPIELTVSGEGLVTQTIVVSSQ